MNKCLQFDEKSYLDFIVAEEGKRKEFKVQSSKKGIVISSEFKV
jgi:hypothetical protein